MMNKSNRFVCINEALPAEKWCESYERMIPNYLGWFLSEGIESRPDYQTCRNMLETHMPELLGIWEHMIDISAGGDWVARFLSLYNPPPFITGCSQAWIEGENPVLIRNYDYHPDYTEGICLKSNWCGKDVIAMTDCLIGALDGMNSDGLVVSLAFGGSQTVGEGFGIPIIIRYLLETCSTIHDAVKTLSRIPSNMPYNVSLLDPVNGGVTAFVHPNRPIVLNEQNYITNSQYQDNWEAYISYTDQLNRELVLSNLMKEAGNNYHNLKHAFVKEPLYSTRYGGAFGTLYTASYFPKSLEVVFDIVDQSIAHSFKQFNECELLVNYMIEEREYSRSPIHVRKILGRIETHLGGTNMTQKKTNKSAEKASTKAKIAPKSAEKKATKAKAKVSAAITEAASTAQPVASAGFHQKPVAVITGANRGLGFELARLTAQMGYTVVLTSRDTAKGEKATKALQKEGLDVIYRRLDLTKIITIQNTAAFVQNQYGRLDLLINNAGKFSEIDTITNLSTQMFNDYMSINALGALRVVQAFLPLLKKQKYGQIVNVSSAYANWNSTGVHSAAYRISKNGLNYITKMLAEELFADNISVQAICPGWLQTEMGGKNAPFTVQEGAIDFINRAGIINYAYAAGVAL